jgi:hypothetical protein
MKVIKCTALFLAGLALLIWDWLGREVDDSKHDWWINQW